MSGKENELREKWNTINYYSGGALNGMFDMQRQSISQL